MVVGARLEGLLSPLWLAVHVTQLMGPLGWALTTLEEAWPDMLPNPVVSPLSSTLSSSSLPTPSAPVARAPPIYSAEDH